MSIELRSTRAEQQSGRSAGVEPAVLRARCGRVLPPMHLTELEETVSQRHRSRALIVLCGAENPPEPEPCDSETDDCLGCADCLRYCSACVDAANRWFATTAQQ